MLNIGASEWLLIAIVVLLIFGPDRIPEIAKKLGKAVHELRRTVGPVRESLQAVDPFAKPAKPLQPTSEDEKAD